MTIETSTVCPPWRCTPQVRTRRAVGDPRQRHAAGARRCSCRSRSWARPPQQLRAYIDGKDPLTGRPVMQEVIEGLTQPLDDSEDVKADRLTIARRRGWSMPTPRRTCSSSSSTTTGPTSCPSSCRRRSAWRRCWRTPAASRTRWSGHMRSTHFREYWEYTVEKVAVNAVMAGARPEYFPVILALAATGVTARGSTIELGGGHGGGQRADPPRDRHERGHRRHGALQPRQRHHRPRLRPALAERPGRLGARAHLHGLAGQQLRLQQRHLRRERGAQPVGAVPRRSMGSRPSDSTVSVFTGCRSTAFTLGLREKHWREHVRNMLRGMDAHSPPDASCSIPSPRGSSSTAAASTPRRS